MSPLEFKKGTLCTVQTTDAGHVVVRMPDGRNIPGATVTGLDVVSCDERAPFGAYAIVRIFVELGGGG